MLGIPHPTRFVIEAYKKYYEILSSGQDEFKNEQNTRKTTTAKA